MSLLPPRLDLDRIRQGDMRAVGDAFAQLLAFTVELGAKAARRTGRWREVAFTAGAFTANGGGTWTVGSADVTGWRYAVLDDLLVLIVALDSTTVGASTSALQMQLPLGLLAADTMTVGGWTWRLTSSAVAQMAAVQLTAGSGTIAAVRWTDGGALPTDFPAVTNDLGLAGVLVCRVLPTAT